MQTKKSVKIAVGLAVIIVVSNLIFLYIFGLPSKVTSFKKIKLGMSMEELKSSGAPELKKASDNKFNHGNYEGFNVTVTMEAGQVHSILVYENEICKEGVECLMDINGLNFGDSSASIIQFLGPPKSMSEYPESSIKVMDYLSLNLKLVLKFDSLLSLSIQE